MAKVTFKSANTYNKIFEDLEKYLQFCREYGYRFDEYDLYNNKSAVFRNYGKFLAGKPVKNNWETDGTK